MEKRQIGKRMDQVEFFVINLSNELTVEKKADRNENLKAAEKYALTREGMSQCPFLGTNTLFLKCFLLKFVYPKEKQFPSLVYKHAVFSS